MSSPETRDSSNPKSFPSPSLFADVGFGFEVQTAQNGKQAPRPEAPSSLWLPFPHLGTLWVPVLHMHPKVPVVPLLFPLTLFTHRVDVGPSVSPDPFPPLRFYFGQDDWPQAIVVCTGPRLCFAESDGLGQFAFGGGFSLLGKNISQNCLFHVREETWGRISVVFR